MNKIKKPAEVSDAIAFKDDPNVIFQKTMKYGNRTQVARVLVRKFFTDCSVPGFKFFCEPKRHCSERIFWILAFITATVLSGISIKKSWQQWQDSPVIVSFAEKSTPIWAVPFPSVTICPETKAIGEKLNFSDTFVKIRDYGDQANISEEIMERIETMTQLCAPALVELLNFTTNFTDSHVYDVLRDIAPPFDDWMHSCSLLYDSKSCKNSFQPIITEEGICYTFNALNSQEVYTEEMAPEMMTVNSSSSKMHWNLEDGYKNADISYNFFEIYPRRMLDSGDGSGLQLFLLLDKKSLDYICNGPSQGFKVVLHTPGDIPQVSKHFFRLPVKRELTVSIKPNMITTSENLRDYDVTERQCYFNSERQLRFFKTYTQRNCELECLSNFTKIECGCVRFSSPRDKDTLICGEAKVKCCAEARNKLIQNFFEKSKGSAAHGACNCLPSCTSITYDAEISQSKFNIAKSLEFLGFNNTDIINSILASSLSISFKEQQFQTSKRSELFGLVGFLSNCGGILSLFIGISALSLVEIFYYCTLRLAWTLHIYRFGADKHNRTDSVAPQEQPIENGFQNENTNVTLDESNHI